MPIPLVYPLDPIHDLSFEVHTQVLEFLQAKKSITNFHRYLEISIFNHRWILKHIPHLEYPYLIPYLVDNYYHVPKETLCYLWYMFEAHTIAFIFDIPRLFAYLNQCLINPIFTHNQVGLMKWFQWFHLITTWQQMLQTHHAKYAIITFRNPTDIIQDNKVEHVSYTHDPQAKIIQWYTYNLADEYHSHLADWVIFKVNMSSLNNTNYAEIPVIIAADPFVDPQHPISQRLFEGVEAFFDRIGFLGDSSAESSPFVDHWDDSVESDID